MQTDLSLKEMQKEWHGSLFAYIIGFFTSLFLTCTSFFLVVSNLISGTALVVTLVSLALLQAMFQLLFFLHLGQEAKPRWETLIFFFMLLILVIVAFGSLWIMHDLDDRLMSDMKHEMTHD